MMLAMPRNKMPGGADLRFSRATSFMSTCHADINYYSWPHAATTAYRDTRSQRAFRVTMLN